MQEVVEKNETMKIYLGEEHTQMEADSLFGLQTKSLISLSKPDPEAVWFVHLDQPTRPPV
jgi:hypothetical protein